MKKVIITSPKFTGQMVAMYGEPGIGEDAFPPLVSVDLREATLNRVQREHLVRTLPVNLGPGFEQAFGSNTVKVTVVEAEVDFEEDFWKRYGKKVNKDRCVKLWDKMRPDTRAMAVAGLGAYLRYLSRCSWRNKKDPEGYLREQMWLTEWDSIES